MDEKKPANRAAKGAAGCSLIILLFLGIAFATGLFSSDIPPAGNAAARPDPMPSTAASSPGTQPPSAPPNGESGDPYAAGQQQLHDSEYAQRKAELLDLVRTAQFAYRCRVIGETEATMLYQFGPNRISQEDISEGRPDYHPDLLPAAKAAAVEADARAKLPGACTYWLQHPEAVAEIRQQAQLALTP